MKKWLNITFYVASSIILFSSCKKDQDPVTVPMGTITGKIVAANNRTAVRVATIFITNDGQLYLTHTDANGNFTLEAPAGNRHLTIQSGDGSMFRTEMDVVVTEGQTTAIATQAVILNQVANLAYITGTYDEIESILIDSMGYTATAITWATVSTMAGITPYDAIFINCGTEGSIITNTLIDNNLASYVANGGSLYVSDYAVKALVGQHVMSSNPCLVERPGGFIADSLLCVRKTGTVSTVISAPIVSPSLQAFLNKPTINEIIYNLGSWEKINTLDAGFWETMVTDPGGNPLLIRTNLYTNPSKGTFNIGSSANNGYSQVCVPGTGSQRITLTVNASEVPSLMSAGATMGACNNLDASGRIYYTTFHNEPNGHISADIKNILEYVILNL